MAIRINGRFSEQDRATLEQGYRNIVFSVDDGDEEDQAYSERGLRGLSYAINFWQLFDAEKARKYAELLASGRRADGHNDNLKVLSPEQVKQISALLAELNPNLDQLFDANGVLKPEKAEFIKEVLPSAMIRKTENDNGEKVDAVVEPLWELRDAKRYLAVAARLNQEVLLGN